MKLKLSLNRPTGPVDLLVTTDADTLVSDVATAIQDLDPSGFGGVADGAQLTLAVVAADQGALDPSVALADSGLRSGTPVVVVDVSDSSDRTAKPVAVVEVLHGLDTGMRVEIPEGTAFIGRSSTCAVRLSDPLVSRQHVRLLAAPGAAEVTDLGSANGIQLNDVDVARSDWRPGDRLQVGDSLLGVELIAQPDLASETGKTEFNRSPVVDPAYVGPHLDCPELPELQRRQRFPVLPMLAPIVLGGALYLVTQSLTSLIFIALSPMMMVANLVETRMTSARGGKEAVADFHRQLAELSHQAEEAARMEQVARNAEHPTSADCIAAASRQDVLLWSRRPRAPRFLELRVGTATLPSRTTFEAPRERHAVPRAKEELDECRRKYATIDGVPSVVRLEAEGAFGISGDDSVALDLARAVLVQIAALHSPAEVVVAGFLGLGSIPQWDWLKWLPHASSPHSPIGGQHLVSGVEAADLLLELEAICDRRLEDSGRSEGLSEQRVVVVVDHYTASDRARLVELAKAGSSVGVYVIWIAPARHQLPAVCDNFIEVGVDGVVSLADTRAGTQALDSVEQVSGETALSFARGLAPIVDSGAVVDDDSDLPRTVAWLDLHGQELADSPEAVIERWLESRSIVTGPMAPPAGRRRSGGLRAIVGQAAGEPHALDLRAHGPHALLGGTTGAGKSELLQSWILSLASLHSPQRVNFLLVDYKGGSAFSDCVNLPHTVGLVTDLSSHLVQRALTSLSAELTYREQLFARKKVKDLIALEETGDTDAPPSLVIVVDEFAALVQEVPEFVNGVVNVAQRGRSLGLHLILATQRPTGVIKDNLRANTNLRLALRMADEGDSTDVLGTPQAASFDPALPGRAMSKTGPGRLVSFQSAYSGGWTTGARRRPDISIEELGIGKGRRWERPEVRTVADESVDRGPADIARVTACVCRASDLAGMHKPRRPWLDELASVYELARVPTARRDGELVFGVADQPASQRQTAAAFYPDRDGNLAIFGTGGAGKTTTLRSLAAAAAITLRGGPCQIQGLDFGSRGLQMLEGLPHVGSIVPGDERDRVNRLIRTMTAALDERARRYAAVKAATITDYRRIAGAPDEPRILVLLDGLPSFRQQYEAGDGARWFDAFVALAADGRPVGIHIVLTADRPGALAGRLSAAIPRRLVLRLGDDNDYAMAGADKGVFTADPSPGRGVFGGLEVQVAVLGGSPDSVAQSMALEQLKASMERHGAPVAPRIKSLPEHVRLSDLPVEAAGLPVIGLADDTLAAVGFNPTGTLLLTGPHRSGRSTALATVVMSLSRWNPRTLLVYLGNKHSPIISVAEWQQVGTSPEDVAACATELTGMVAGGRATPGLIAVVVEGLADFLGTIADVPLTGLLKTLLAHDQLIIAEGETSTLAQSWPLINAARSSRSGIALQPDQADGFSVFKTDFPKCRRGEFVPGRGFIVSSGRTALLQVAMPE